MWRIWAAALFWGLNWPVVKILLTGTGPWTLRSVGLALGFLLLAATTLLMGQSLRIPRSHWPQLLIAGLLNVACFNLFSVFAQMTMPASRAVIITYTMPLWSVLFARIMLGERIDALRAAALCLGATGIALLAKPFWLQAMAGELPVGLIFVLTAAITWAAGTVYTKRARIPGAPLAITAWQILLGSLVATVGLVLFETPRLELWRPEIAATFAYHVIFPQAAAYALWFSLMTRIPASTLSLGTLLVPVFGVGGAMLMIGEEPTWLELAGFAVIMLAIVLDQGVRAWADRGKPVASR
ncbi:MAG: DMT family transporter [Hyphomicrobiaceae bacterium]